MISTHKDNNFERTVECPAEWFDILYRLLRPGEHHIAVDVKDARNLCVWTAFHEKRLIFIPRQED
jgi:hypothetical protein